jgi:hypothetical protein
VSRIGEGNEWAFWAHRAKQAQSSKRGLRAFAELREALLALPEKRLIARALCTAALQKAALESLAAEQRAGVGDLSPEQRFDYFLTWIDKRLATAVLVPSHDLLRPSPRAYLRLPPAAANRPEGDSL